MQQYNQNQQNKINQYFDNQNINQEQYTKFKDKIVPKFNQKIYSNIPEILKIFLYEYKEYPETMDVTLISAMATISSILPNYSAVIRKENIESNLLALIIAPAGSGKGAAGRSFKLIEKVDNSIIQESIQQIEKYNQELEFNHADKNSTNQKPVYKTLEIPINATEAAFYKQLLNNKGRGLICTTEARDFAKAISENVSDYKSLILQAFHHEKHSRIRLKDNDGIGSKIDKIFISQVATGTPSIIPKILDGGAEDGLASRFIYYCFENEIKINYGDFIQQTNNYVIEQLQESLKIMYEQLLNNQLSFCLTETQIDKLNEFYQQRSNTNKEINKELASSYVTRMGIMTVRIAMICSILRKIQWFNASFETETKIICTDLDFELALEIGGTLFEHAKAIYVSLEEDKPVNFNNNILSKAQTLFYENANEKELKELALGILYKHPDFNLKYNEINDLCGAKYTKQWYYDRAKKFKKMGKKKD